MASRVFRMKIKTKIKEINRIGKEIGKDKNVLAVYLFGSYFHGKIHKNSDIDLCIITKDEYEEVNFPVTDNLDVSFFHKLPITAQFRILNNGKPLFIRNKDIINNIKIITLRNYLDIKPLINKHLMEKFKCTI